MLPLFCLHLDLSFQKFRSRGKSAHDLANDEKLSKETVAVDEEDAEITKKASARMEAEAEARRRRREIAARLETEEEIRRKEKRMCVKKLIAFLIIFGFAFAVGSLVSGCLSN